MKKVTFSWDGELTTAAVGESRRGEVRLGEAEYLWLEKGLRSIGMFSSLTLKNMAAVLPYMRLYEYPKGTSLCREGEPGDRFFLIYKGTVDVTKEGGIFENAPAKLARLRPGDFFGEMALLFNQPRSATCTAASESRIFVLMYGDFKKLLKRNPDFLKRVRRVAKNRLRDLSKLWGKNRLT